eukprot:COSAG05_NODE_1588_length_4478_cov_4.553094_3_plen_304_part_00
MQLVARPVLAKLWQVVKQTIEPGVFSTTLSTQIWVLFSRRFRRVLAAPWIIVTQFVQNCVITFGCALAFSYKAESEDRDTLQHPYKSLMFLFCITSYCMVLQYLLLPAEHAEERPILWRERDSSLCKLASLKTAGIARTNVELQARIAQCASAPPWLAGRMPSYLVACFLNETPRAFIQALTLFFVGRACGAGLNEESTYSVFGVLLLTFGAGAFQSQVAVCSAVTDSVTVTCACPTAQHVLLWMRTILPKGSSSMIAAGGTLYLDFLALAPCLADLSSRSPAFHRTSSGRTRRPYLAQRNGH